MLEEKKDGWKAALALTPAMIFLIVFMFFPIFYTFTLSFMEGFRWKSGAMLWIFGNWYTLFPSLKNYGDVLSDPVFIMALKNTATLVIISVPLTITISLLIAVSLNGIKKLKGFYQTIFFLPYVTNAIALGMVFNVMFGSTPSGLVNQLITLFGGDWQVWLAAVGGGPNAHFKMGVVIIVYSIWEGIAFKILVFMSGLASIDKQYYDAARVDGTSRGRIFSRITVPLLSPQILYITITSFIGAFKAYSSVISLFGAGAYNFGGITGKSWITVVGYIYIAMRDSKTTRAAAGSIILLCIILIITVVQFWVSKKRVHY